MQPDSSPHGIIHIHNEHIEEIRQALQPYVGYLVITGVIVILVMVFRTYLEEWAGGLVWRVGCKYRPLDVVKLFDRDELGYIEHLGWLSSVFTLFIFDNEGQIIGGWSLTILNNELRHTMMARLKPQIDIPDALRKAVGRP